MLSQPHNAHHIIGVNGCRNLSLTVHADREEPWDVAVVGVWYDELPRLHLDP